METLRPSSLLLGTMKTVDRNVHWKADYWTHMAAIVEGDQDLDDKSTRLEHGQQVESEYGNGRLHPVSDEETGLLDDVRGQEGRERSWTISPYITGRPWPPTRG